MDVPSPVTGKLERWLKSTDKKQNSIRVGDRLCTVSCVGSGGSFVVQAKQAGDLSEVCVQVGDEVTKGGILCRISPCQHPAILNSMCVACGEPVKVASSSVSALSLNGGQQLQVSQREAAKVQESKLNDLQRIKKLALILDLDHTLVHATELQGPPQPQNLMEEGVYLLMLEDKEGVTTVPAQAQAQAPGHGQGQVPGAVAAKHHLLAKRPYLDTFLAQAHKICQMTIYTAGTRRYAEAVARIIDPTGVLFKGRMVSRSDVPNDKTGGLEKSLQRLFLGDSSMAVIMDDREDVWKGEQASHLLLVRPFHHFRMGREVNNASGPVSASAASVSGTSLDDGGADILQNRAIIALSGDSAGRFLQPDGVSGTAPKDDQLLRCLEVLRNLHAQFFGGEEGERAKKIETGTQALKIPAVTREKHSSAAYLLTKLKSQVLAGCVITFSGIIPVNEKDPRNHREWRLAESLGAQVSRDVSSRTTHLISVQTHTQKVMQCLQRGNVWVLHPDWLWHCRYALTRVLEQTFMITALEPGKDLPNPILDSSPLTDAGGDGDCDDKSDRNGNESKKRSIEQLSPSDASVLEKTDKSSRPRFGDDDVVDENDEDEDDDDDGFGEDGLDFLLER